MTKEMLRIIVLVCALSASWAEAIPVSYELSTYSNGGFSANWLHSADGCRHGDLFMCNGSAPSSFLIGITNGSLHGDYDGGQLSGITGNLNLAANPLFGALTITGGVLNGSHGYLDYALDAAFTGRFFFEPLGFGDGMPNDYSLERMILWGQNADAYASAASWDPGPTVGGSFLPLGIDLHATLVSVPEPGSLSLLGAGMLAIGLIRRRRRAA